MRVPTRIDLFLLECCRESHWKKLVSVVWTEYQALVWLLRKGLEVEFDRATSLSTGVIAGSGAQELR